MAHSLVIDNGHFFDATKAAKLVFKVAFLGPDAQPKHTKDIRRIGLLILLVSRVEFSRLGILTKELTVEWDDLRGGDLLERKPGLLSYLLDSPLAPLADARGGLRERDLPRVDTSSRSAGAGAGGAL